MLTAGVTSASEDGPFWKRWKRADFKREAPRAMQQETQGRAPSDASIFSAWVCGNAKTRVNCSIFADNCIEEVCPGEKVCMDPSSIPTQNVFPDSLPTGMSAQAFLKQLGTTAKCVEWEPGTCPNDTSIFGRFVVSADPNDPDAPKVKMAQNLACPAGTKCDAGSCAKPGLTKCDDPDGTDYDSWAKYKWLDGSVTQGSTVTFTNAEGVKEPYADKCKSDKFLYEYACHEGAWKKIPVSCAEIDPSGKCLSDPDGAICEFPNLDPKNDKDGDGIPDKIGKKPMFLSICLEKGWAPVAHSGMKPDGAKCPEGCLFANGGEWYVLELSDSTKFVASIGKGLKSESLLEADPPVDVCKFPKQWNLTTKSNVSVQSFWNTSIPGDNVYLVAAQGDDVCNDNNGKVVGNFTVDFAKYNRVLIQVNSPDIPLPPSSPNLDDVLSATCGTGTK